MIPAGVEHRRGGAMMTAHLGGSSKLPAAAAGSILLLDFLYMYLQKNNYNYDACVVRLYRPERHCRRGPALS